MIDTSRPREDAEFVSAGEVVAAPGSDYFDYEKNFRAAQREARMKRILGQ